MGRYASQTWAQKARDGPGFRSLVGQVLLDNSILVTCYIPVFYILKASIFTGSSNPVDWVKTGTTNLKENWSVDAARQVSVWIPLDFLCFSVPLYLRLPIRHIFSLMWTIYFSWFRGANKPKEVKSEK